MATTKIEGAAVREVLLADTGWVEVRDFRAIPASQSVDGVSLGASVTFETQTGRRTVPASAVLDVYTISAEAEAEAKQLRQAANDAEAVRLFRWQHCCDRETYDGLAEGQNWRCGKCGTNLEQARFVHKVNTDEGPVLLCRDLYAGCSPLSPRLGLPNDG